MSRTSTSASIRLATSAPSVSLSPTRISSVVTVSFSLMIGITAEFEQRAQRRARVEVAPAVGEILVRQQHLRRVQPELHERRFVRLDEAHLPDGRGGLQFVDRLRPRGPAQARLMPSAMAPDDTSTTSRPSRFSCAISSAQRATARVVEPAPVVGDEARADLDDEPLGAGDDRNSCFRWRSCVAGASSTGAGDTTTGAASSAASAASSSADTRLRVEPLLDREREFAAAFAVDRGDREHRAFPAIGLHERGDARRALVLRESGRACSARASAACRTAPRRRASVPSRSRARRAPDPTSVSSGARSTRCSSRRVRARWRRKRWPRPAPSAAPSISPGNVRDDEAARFATCARRPGSAPAW